MCGRSGRAKNSARPKLRLFQGRSAPVLSRRVNVGKIFEAETCKERLKTGAEPFGEATISWARRVFRPTYFCGVRLIVVINFGYPTIDAWSVYGRPGTMSRVEIVPTNSDRSPGFTIT